MAKTWGSQNWELGEGFDVHHLEREAALNQFEKGMPRTQAEELAYNTHKEDLRKKSAIEAAAHHYSNMKDSSGDIARMHAKMYEAHMKGAGLEHYPVPKEILAAVQHARLNSSYKPHKHDEALLKQIEAKKKGGK
jgi:hypothetical protein